MAAEADYAVLGGEEDGVVNAAEVPEKEPSASLFASVANICNVVIGAGVLALPFAYARAGYAGGPVLVVWSAGLNVFTMHLLAVVGRQVAGKNASFHAIAAASLPKRLWWFVDAVVVTMMLGIGSSYIIVFGNLCSVATKPMVASAGRVVGVIFGSRPAWVTIAIVVVSPMSYAKSVDVLKYTSTLGLFFMIYVAALVTASFAAPDSIDPCMDDAKDGVDHCGGSVKKVAVNIGTLEALSLTTFAYNAQLVVPPVANELRGYTAARMDAAIGAAIAICAVLYCVVGHAGYETFGWGVNSDLLESYHASPAVTVARFAISLVVSFSVPIMCNVFRRSTKSILEHQRAYPSLARAVVDRPDAFHVGASTFFLAFCYAIALAVDDLGLVLSLIGATGSTVIAYLIPTWAFCAVFPDDPALKFHPRLFSSSARRGRVWPRRWKRVAARCVGVYALLAMPFCVASAFLNA